MAVKVHSAQVLGLKAGIIDVEAEVSSGLYSFSIVGLADKAVEESKDRISAAIKNSGFTSPQKKNQKIIVSLAPADIKKEGPVFDLPIALSYLLASKQILFETKKKIFLGELALDGALRAVKGVLPLVAYAKEKGYEEVYLPEQNVEEAALIGGIKVFGCENLLDLIKHLDKRDSFKLLVQPQTKIDYEDLSTCAANFYDIQGQETAKRGLEIAAAGGHNVLMVGPAGTGKTMLARAFPTILPPLSFDEILEVTAIHSVSGLLDGGVVKQRPFRSPHHTSSYVSIVGGGAYPKPGEITLSHRGVLFLDEFSEFESRVIDTLRQPLEDGVVHVSRARMTLSFPARFILICAMNPCSCGNFGSKTKECICSQSSLARHKRKISGPVVDRIDLWLEVPQVEHRKLSEYSGGGEESAKIRDRVAKAREIQKKRFAGGKGKLITNSEMGAKEIKEFAPLSDAVKKILNSAAENLDLSARAYHRVIKIARTIADLDGEKDIQDRHVLEALQYRPK